MITLNQVDGVLQVASVALLGLVCLFLVRQSKQGQHVWTGIGFTLSVICYLLVESEFARIFPALRLIVLTGAICVSIFFWLLAKAIFDDHFKPSPITALWFLLQIIPPYAYIYFRYSSFISDNDHAIRIIPQIISIGFLLVGLITAIRTRSNDLVDSRLHFRNYFIIATALVIGLTLIIEIANFGDQSPNYLQVWQRATILGLTAFFLVSILNVKSGFFFKEIAKPKLDVPEDPVLAEKLQSFLKDQKIYRKEGLTIRELAELMNEQEYRVRRVINGQLGFKNFNDFLNQYRVKEASEILYDPAENKKTILEIAYQLGYKSIGPFNKAFKEQTGATPTAYRKSQPKI